MSGSRDLTLGIRFNTRELQRQLDKIKAIITEINNISRQSNILSNKLARSLRQQAQLLGGVPLPSPAPMTENIFQALMAATQLEKIVDGLGKGINDGVKFISGVANKAIGIVTNSFKEAMKDQLADIQAMGSMYGALQQGGFVQGDAKGYETSRDVYKQLDIGIAQVVKKSVAPTAMITQYSRALSDNLVPTLLKQAVDSGKSVEQAIKPISKQLATFYEKMALLTPAGYSPGMVSRAMQKALQGEGKGNLSKYDFFQLNPIVLSSMDKLGFFKAKDFSEKLKIMEKALELGLPAEAIREMNSTISGGIQGLQDTLFNPSVGLFSFAREFDTEDIGDIRILDKVRTQYIKMQVDGYTTLQKESQTEFIKRMNSPLKIVGSTLGPFLQSMADFFGNAGTVMGHLAIMFNTYFGPPLRALTANIEVLVFSLEKGKMNFAFTLGRFVAEVYKQITFMLDIKGLFGEANRKTNNFLTEFMAGFNSLTSHINFQLMLEQTIDAVTVFVQSGLAKVITAIVGFFVAKALIETVVSIFLQIAIITLGGMLKALAINLIKTLIPKIGMLLLKAVGVALSPIGLTVIGIAAAIAALIVIAIRHRETITKYYQGLAQMISGIFQFLYGIIKIVGVILLSPILITFEALVRTLQAIGIVSKETQINSSLELIKQTVNSGVNDVKAGATNTTEGFKTAAVAGAQTLQNLGADVATAAAGLGKMATNAIDKLSATNDKTQQQVDKAIVSSNKTANLSLDLASTTVDNSAATASVASAANGLKPASVSAWSALKSAMDQLGKSIQFISFMSASDSVAPGGELSGDKMEKAKMLFEKLRSMGYSRYAAAALVGSAIQESGLNPAAVQSGGGGRGMWQWDGARRDKLMEKYGKDWTSLQNQLEYLEFEVNGSEKAAGQRLKNASSMAEAKAAEKAFIRYGIEGARYSNADQVLAQPWAKFGGYLPPSTNNSQLSNAVSQTKVGIKQRAQAQTSNNKNLSINVNRLDPKYSTEEQLNLLGQRVASGVVFEIDKALNVAPLYYIGA